MNLPATVATTAATRQPSHRAAVRPTRARLAVSLVVATTLNLVALSVLAGVVSEWHASPERAVDVAPVTLVRALAITPVSTAPVSLAPPALADAVPPPADTPESMPESTPEVEPDAPTTDEALNEALDEASDQAAVDATDPATEAPIERRAPTHFYRSSEVDRAAEPAPESDWNLDTAALDSAGIGRLVFEVFVNRNGDIVECAILEPTTLAADIKVRFEARLREGKLTPAQRGGVAVASTRKIELSVEGP